MLRAGFKVVKHAPHHGPRTHRLWLSPDLQKLWWQSIRDDDDPVAQFLVADLHAILSHPPERLVDPDRIPCCFMLVFNLGQSTGARVRRRMVVFEATTLESKYLLVDGFRLLKDVGLGVEPPG